MRTVSALLLVTCWLSAGTIKASDVCNIVSGATVMAQDDENTILGKVANAYDSKSIFNEYGDHGSPYAAKSIWNEYGRFGGQYSTHSPFNQYTSTPPILIKGGKAIGYLTVNKALKPGISPNLLKELCKDTL